MNGRYYFQHAEHVNSNLVRCNCATDILEIYFLRILSAFISKRSLLKKKESKKSKNKRDATFNYSKLSSYRYWILYSNLSLDEENRFGDVKAACKAA